MLSISLLFVNFAISPKQCHTFNSSLLKTVILKIFETDELKEMGLESSKYYEPITEDTSEENSDEIHSNRESKSDEDKRKWGIFWEPNNLAP